jgi:UDP-N-acetylmuramoyl-L-alanyl-D-glutamate--2,6-diaminopimelate ligase
VSRHAPLPLSRLLAPLREAGLLVAATGNLDVSIDALAHDSRAVEPGTCFFAIKGEYADGHLFIDKAVQHGATAVVCASPPSAPPDGVALVTVTDSRAALAEVAAEFFGHPSRELRLVGVTGTNGKTTTAYLLHHVLTALGETTGLIGTVEVRIGDAVKDATHTTPDALALNALLREMVDAGCSACAAEVSSHALAQQRARAQRFAAAVFTNLSHDHLDYHGTVEAYRDAKASLFAGLDADAVAIVNRDDAAWRAMVTESAARTVTYGASGAGPAADVPFEIGENAPGGLRLRLDGEVRRFRVAGAFNAYNLAAAYAVARTFGYDRDAVLDALAEAPAPPGRLETIRADDGTVAIVDYAHTPDALDNVLRTVREMMPADASLTCVFGCGGDRDRTKRPEMGAIAERRADRVVLTNDNPRTEDPAAILAEIRAGMSDPDAATVVADRAEAIRRAVADAAPGDVIVVAGKGHETYQIVGTERRDFDDREQVRQRFRERSQIAH